MSQTTQSVVEAVGISKIFRDFWGRPKAIAVDDIHFTVDPGQVLGFLGPNGSGKSTTVKMLLGLLRPTSGSLKVFDHAPSHVGVKMRIGYLPEETYLYRYLTAGETLDFFGSLFNLTATERRQRTQQLLEMVGLGHSANRPVGEFSKGMARRIGLAQALINDPDLVILDEPTSGLDPIGIREVKNLIKHLADRGKTIILCSHLLADVEDVCDQVMVMYAGKIRVRGPLNELLTVDEQTRIVSPALAPDVLERVLSILNEAAGANAVSVDKPTRNLEEFFLDVIQQARQEGKKTAGVQESGEIAAYLGGEKEDDEAAVKEVLEALTQPEEPASEPEQPEIAPEETKPDEEMLEHLAKDEEPPEEEEKTDDGMTEEERAAQNERLRALLEGDVSSSSDESS